MEAAQLVKKTLDAVGLAGYPKTTGGDGMHIYIPLEPVYTYEQVRSFAELLSILVINQNPDLFTTPRTVSRRKKGESLFRLPADLERQNNRRALRFASPSRRSRLHAAGLV